MNIVQCIFCKKPFMQISGKICPECLEQIDKDFVVVRDYIWENKTTNIDTVSEKTGIDRKKIVYLIKEGRLIIDSPDGEGGGLIHCESCKKSIKTGRLCESCADSIANTMNKAAETIKSPSADKGEEVRSIKGSAKIGK